MRRLLDTSARARALFVPLPLCVVPVASLSGCGDPDAPTETTEGAKGMVPVK